jgi:hypothetical protein
MFVLESIQANTLTTLPTVVGGAAILIVLGFFF